MTREEELAEWLKPLAWRRGLRVKGDYTVEVEETTLTREQLTALLGAVLAHLGERREQECGPVEKCPVCRHNTVHVSCVHATLQASQAQLRAQAAAHSASVLEIQTRMLAMEQVVEAARKRLHMHQGAPHIYQDGRMGGCSLCDALAEAGGR